eukprot:Pompholyxophrys_sp_v1_NODE_1_length_32789_cov_6.460653.p20 type:complete len:206 gc:universal NODE_1_length_32789_cov_6.460653:8065-7448(-)
MTSYLYDNTYLDILERYGDPGKVNHVKSLMAEIRSEIEFMLLDQSKSRMLDAEEIKFLKSVRLIDKLKMDRNALTTQANGRHKVNTRQNFRYAPYVIEFVKDKPNENTKSIVKPTLTGIEDNSNAIAITGYACSGVAESNAITGIACSGVAEGNAITGVARSVVEQSNVIPPNTNSMQTDISKTYESETDHMTDKFTKLKLVESN